MQSAEPEIVAEEGGATDAAEHLLHPGSGATGEGDNARVFLCPLAASVVSRGPRIFRVDHFSGAFWAGVLCPLPGD